MPLERTHWLYALTIFLSAFLLFQIQPLIGRVLLPWFGGASAVWAASLLFFTAMLFVGYAYAYGISRLAYARQALIHLSILGIGAVVVCSFPLIFGSVFPPLDWTTESALHPSLLVLVALAALIGVPYFLLATTGPLLQYWFGVKESREPYQLYVLSNIGSFLALGSYPFVIEPLLPLSVQGIVWTMLFSLFAALYALVAWKFLKSARARALPHAENTRDDSLIPYADRLQWIACAALPAALMVAVTTTLTQTLIPVPFLWVLPLGLYLITFIIAFRGWGGGGLNAFLVVLLAWAVFGLLGYKIILCADGT